MSDAVELTGPCGDRMKGLLNLAIAAGEEILKIYAEDFSAMVKGDGSPVTVADQAAEDVILKGLEAQFPGVPVVAEESVEAGRLPEGGDRYFLVDPLDGTKEFLKKNGEFTVNIALIEHGAPVFGVVYAPALNEIFWGGALPGGDKDTGAYQARVQGTEIFEAQKISVRCAPDAGLSVLASRSHLSKETEALIAKLNVAEKLSVGSSLKLCWVAAGRADLYPRMAPTMLWDIAAGDALVRAAGGRVVLAETGEDFVYKVPPGATKDDLRNPHFIAVSDIALLP
ncbi:3'(2'),5'-bisphosphate nucleotidase CysQ [Roseibium sp.]|uniref:3'(2'),5'-bisphosphate nucleotidase CysQ n=1 Tax=Roseibium sp. TaxID=1936156 RepID=UPI003B52D874